MFFYCPKCGYQKEIDRKDIPRNAIPNIRDGWGRGIYHFECPNCGNLDAGCMVHEDTDHGDIEYIKYVIGMYQNVRSKG